ncbi:MAG TPA: lysophospholipid acyltransferase family protein [Gemmatimonadaceae bacterium]|nr:lysophospholipid acyltransferase family protein [Gemmatimonadaceae bacterium]
MTPHVTPDESGGDAGARRPDGEPAEDSRAPHPRWLGPAVALGALLIRALGATWRVRMVNRDAVDRMRAQRQPFVWAFWHAQILPIVWHHRGDRASALISSHRDGEIIAQIAQRLGIQPIRGSTSRGASRALLAIVRELQGGTEVAVTPDGPRGPARTFAPGALVAAQRAGVPIIAIACSASRAWRLRSWDRFMIPKPFAKITFAYSDPTPVRAPSPREAALEADRFGQLVDATESAAAAALR